MTFLIQDVQELVEDEYEKSKPDYIGLQIGGSEIADSTETEFKMGCTDLVDWLMKRFPEAKIVWIDLLVEIVGKEINLNDVDSKRRALNGEIAVHVLEKGGHYLRLPHDYREFRRYFKFKDDNVHMNLTKYSIAIFEEQLHSSLQSIIDRNMYIVPDMKALSLPVHRYVGRNKHKFPSVQKKFFRPGFKYGRPFNPAFAQKRKYGYNPSFQSKRRRFDE